MRGMSVSSVASDASYHATLSGRDPFRASDACAVVMGKEPQLMPRLYGPGHFTEDPYSQVVSPHGIPVDDLVAVLQKEIRRSRIDNAVLAAYEMFTTSADVAQHLWRRLRVIAVEDVGMGLPLGPVLIDVLHRNFNAPRWGLDDGVSRRASARFCAQGPHQFRARRLGRSEGRSRRSAGRGPGLRPLRAHTRRAPGCD